MCIRDRDKIKLLVFHLVKLNLEVKRREYLLQGSDLPKALSIFAFEQSQLIVGEKEQFYSIKFDGNKASLSPKFERSMEKDESNGGRQVVFLDSGCPRLFEITQILPPLWKTIYNSEEVY
eukprot:TRINITY_DN25888_c0_g1_i1.p1 TRINITY_DN25888_c0_g1~~TRINITY_DN25888_c0_g1_i1.p1  ORF type:complete len:139 (+),score=22.96 TRINITY_DN25888_c0_g1_i1:60-419(+)